MLIAGIALPGLAIEAHQERGQVRLTIVLAPGRLPSLPPLAKCRPSQVETTGVTTEDNVVPLRRVG